MVLNELSLRDSANDERTARELMSVFIKTINVAVKKGIIILRTENRIYDIIIAPNYPVSRWLNDSQGNREQQDFLLTLATQTPLLKSIADLKIQDKVDLSDFEYRGETVTELGIAYLLDNIAISFNSQEKWNKSHLEIEFTTLNEENATSTSTEQIKVIHACSVEHIEEHTGWINDRIKSTVNNGRELWDVKKELFPNLEFCDSVEQQMYSIQNGDIMLIQVFKRLRELENYCKCWVDGSFDFSKIPTKISPESDSRKSKFKEQLTFQCPDGDKRLFSYHARMTPGAWRLHFCPKAQSRKIIIGYIGIKIQ